MTLRCQTKPFALAKKHHGQWHRLRVGLPMVTCEGTKLWGIPASQANPARTAQQPVVQCKAARVGVLVICAQEEPEQRLPDAGSRVKPSPVQALATAAVVKCYVFLGCDVWQERLSGCAGGHSLGEVSGEQDAGVPFPGHQHHDL